MTRNYITYKIIPVNRFKDLPDKPAAIFQNVRTGFSPKYIAEVFE